MNLIFQIVSSQLQRLMNGASKTTSQTDINNFRIVQYLRAKLSRTVSVGYQSLPNSYYMCPPPLTMYTNQNDGTDQRKQLIYLCSQFISLGTLLSNHPLYITKCAYIKIVCKSFSSET